MFAAKDTLLTRPSGGYQISRSVRLRSSASAYLNRTFGTPTSATTWSFSCWVKRGSLGAFQYILSGGTANNNGFRFTNLDQFELTTGGVATTSASLFRDPSAYGHLTVISNGTTVKGYWNSVEIVSKTGTLAVFNTATLHRIGRSVFSTAFHFDGYLTEINFIDGQALTPSSFGETNALTGVWQPKKYGGTYGTNGFYLNFSDNSTAAALGTDFSGNSNTWTVNNISVTAGATYDSMIDVPTPYADGGNGRGNYCVINPLALCWY
jgi:hypothetical protein